MRNRAARAEKLFNLKGGTSVRACDETVTRLIRILAPAVAERMTNDGQLTPVEHYIKTFKLDSRIEIDI